MDFKATLHLPDPEFGIPMKADLATREPQIQEEWESMNLYERQLAERANAPIFVLHDGPPYTNSPIHLGTALNKISKDFVLKSKAIQGYQVPYVPGYDNHGLPIEQAVVKKLQQQKVEFDVPQLRQACREHAQEYIQLQTKQFKRLGIFGNWDLPYKTMEYGYEAEIVRVFKRLVQADQVYRGLKPVMWSPTSRTALADTEIVYKEHTSKAIYVKFPLRHDNNGWSDGLENVSTVIWTTTPWTIPANLAVAFHPGFEYVIVRAGNEHFVLLKELTELTMSEIGIDEYQIVRELIGATFEHSTFKHPIFDRDSLAVLAEYITKEDGTGVVHTAPGHGRDDFFTGARYGLPILCPVDEKGVLTEEAGEFAGVKYKDCDVVVVDRLQELGALLSSKDYVHQYPHAERDGKPVIFRATEQWFVSIDGNDLRKNILDQIDQVTWHPANTKTRIRGMIANRPDWCISRQRPWGVGIPIFYGAQSGAPVMDPKAIECVAELIEREGSDAWYVRSAAEILPAGYTHPVTGETEFRKENDVFDVWFDSGSSCVNVLDGAVHREWKSKYPADLYLEGSDQHRGWFNVSLIISTALKGVAPFKEVITHGFLNFEGGVKMSKSLGNVIDPEVICSSLGADVLRYWAATIDYQDDAVFSESLLKTAGEGYRKIRNTLRFLISNLKNFEPSACELNGLNAYIVDRTHLLVADVVKLYNEYDFRGALAEIYGFCSVELSATFLDAIKDVMYCDKADSPRRVEAQQACYEILQELVLLIAPILPHTAEEAYKAIPGKRPKASVHLDALHVLTLNEVESIQVKPEFLRWMHLLEYRNDLFIHLENYRQESGTKDPQTVVVTVPHDETLESFSQEELANIFKVSWVQFGDALKFEPTTFERCERSKLYRPDVTEVNGHFLTQRDREAIGW